MSGKVKDLEMRVLLRNNQLKSRREAYGVSQTRLAEMAGVNTILMQEGLEKIAELEKARAENEHMRQTYVAVARGAK